MAELDKKNVLTKLNEASKAESNEDLNSTEKTVFINQDISNLQLKMLLLDGHLFRKCSFYVTSFYGCVFKNCEFLNCNFSSADFLNVKFINCTFVDCDFSDAKFQDVLVEGGFKSNNIFKNLKINNNVIGIVEEETNLISEESETMQSILNSFESLKESNGEYVLKYNNIILSVSNDIASNAWRITIGTELGENYDSIISDTVTEPITNIELYNAIIDIIEAAKEKVKDNLLLVTDLKYILSLFSFDNPEYKLLKNK